MTLPTTVVQIGQVGIHGPIVPTVWLQRIRTKAGLVDANAAILLAIIIDWYQPMPIYNEAKGTVVGYVKKFAADKLQLGYAQISAILGLTRYQARQTVATLVKMGLITTELRKVEIGGVVYSNVMFIEPVVEAVKALSLPMPPESVTTEAVTPDAVAPEMAADTGSADTGSEEKAATPPPENRHTLPRKTGGGYTGKPVDPPPENRGTYTTTTTIPTTTPATDIARKLRAKQNRFDAETVAILEALNGHRMTAEERRRALPFLVQVQEALGRPVDIATAQDLRLWYKSTMPGYPCTWKAIAGNLARYQEWVKQGRKTILPLQSRKARREHDWENDQELEAIRARDRAAGWDKD